MWNAKKSRAGISRRPSGPCAITLPSVSRSSIGISAAASAWQRLPTTVPRLRIGIWATCAITARMSGFARCASALSSSSRWRTMARTAIRPSATVIPLRPSTCWISTRRPGAASRRFIAGTRLWPPASTIALGSPANRATASSSVLGASYANRDGFMVFSGSLAAWIDSPPKLSRGGQTCETALPSNEQNAQNQSSTAHLYIHSVDIVSFITIRCRVCLSISQSFEEVIFLRRHRAGGSYSRARVARAPNRRSVDDTRPGKQEWGRSGLGDALAHRSENRIRVATPSHCFELIFPRAGGHLSGRCSHPALTLRSEHGHSEHGVDPLDARPTRFELPGPNT